MTGGPAGHHRLLATKLTAPLPPPHLVVRSRLQVGLDRGSQRQLTVVSGPLGAGKSTLLATWAAAGPPVAWLSLDDLDNDPARLWTHLIAALHRSTGSGALAALSSGTPTDAYFVSDVAAVISRLDRPVRIVLDNFECLAP